MQKRFCKYLLGIHKKASNLASRLEFGRQLMINYITSKKFKYYSRLFQLPEDRLLKEVFELGKSLFHDGYISCILSYKLLYKSSQLVNQKYSLTTCQKSFQINMNLTKKKKKKKELSLLRNQVHDNKLNTFSKMYSNFSLPKYLSFGLLKVKTKELSKLRVSAHGLLIERGRYSGPKFLVKKDFVQLVIR